MPSKQSLRTAAIAGVLTSSFILADVGLGVVAFGDNSYVVFLGVGFVIGQVNLIAVWASLAPGNIVLRLPWSLLLTVFCWYALLIGYCLRVFYHVRVFPDGSVTPADALFLGFELLGGCVVAQAPLWIASRWRGIRLAFHSDADRTGEGDGQFQLRHLFLGMVMLSFALAPLRIVFPSGELRWPEIQLSRWIVVATAFVLCNLLVTIPCIWGAFLPKRSLLPAAIAWPVYCGVLTALEVITLHIVFGDLPQEITETLGAVYVCNLVQCLVVFAVLLLFRAIGYRLTYAKPLSAGADPVSKPTGPPR